MHSTGLHWPALSQSVCGIVGCSIVGRLFLPPCAQEEPRLLVGERPQRRRLNLQGFLAKRRIIVLVGEAGPDSFRQEPPGASASARASSIAPCAVLRAGSPSAGGVAEPVQAVQPAARPQKRTPCRPSAPGPRRPGKRHDRGRGSAACALSARIPAALAWLRALRGRRRQLHWLGGPNGDETLCAGATTSGWTFCRCARRRCDLWAAWQRTRRAGRSPRPGCCRPGRIDPCCRAPRPLRCPAGPLRTARWQLQLC